MRGLWFIITYISLVSTSDGKPPSPQHVGKLEQDGNYLLLDKQVALQKYVLSLGGQLNATQRQLKESQKELRETRQNFNDLLKNSRAYEASLSDQVRANTKKIKSMNPNCNLQPSNVCGKCECRDDERLEKKFYCSCLNLGAKRDCLDHLEHGATVNGVYRINPNYQNLNVFCDQKDAGGGWTVFQRRMDGSVNFYRNWDDYARGFGALQHEHWLGNERIFLMSVQALYPNGSELKVDLEDFYGNKRYAKYANFQVGNRNTKYTLNVGGFSGDASDGLSYSNRMMFSTYDQDNDELSGSCAAGDAYKDNGAWWYKNCSHSNLNAERYYVAHKMKGCEGIFWNTFTGYCSTKTLKHTTMKMRRK